ncbi:PNK3P-domain-containing protein [Athelia psychrophila]|uniref:PNK3P-domain-containing protein n=1 Tax=Athelia psychrophila TaxID=1759441 RepID=A0A166SYW7_9AGAM|nr:PNK3P-domain-containing protein [Fibularhizoctonia sp. CBS 109695]
MKRQAGDSLEGASAKKAKAEVHPLFSKILGTSPAHPTFEWLKPNLGENKSLLHGINLSPKSCSKVAVFDLDGTVIVQQHWSKANEGQWKWWNSKVPLKLKELHNDGFSIVLLSNQAQRNAGALKAWEAKKIPNVAAACPDLPFRIFGAKEKDGFRKPMPGVWYELQKIFAEHGVDIDKSVSFFVGDAAGRPTDFSSSDRKWAENVGLAFKTPEEFFVGAAHKELPPLVGFHVSQLKKTTSRVTPSNTRLLPPLSAKTTKRPIELVLFVGYPCLGKSSFYRSQFEPAGYKHVNQDILKRREKCIKIVEESLANGESCVVDNTNRDIATRQFYINVAKRLDIPVRCFKFDGSAELAWHNNLYRAYNRAPSNAQDETKREVLPYAAISSFASAYEEPTTSEGFSEIRTVNWVFEGSEEAERRWSMWLQLDDKTQQSRK